MCANALNDHAVAIGWVRLIKRNTLGEVTFDGVYKNQLTTYARQASAQLWIGQTLAAGTPSQIQVGNGSPTAPMTGVDPTDSALWAAIPGSLKPMSAGYPTTWLTYNSQYSVDYQQTDCNGVWTEVGLFDSAGNMWSHVQIANFAKDPAETVTVQWQVSHIAV